MDTASTAIARRRRRRERSFRRAVRTVRRFFASYVSPLGWAVLAAGLACLIAFALLGWYELLVFAIVAAVMLLSAVVLSLGNTRFNAAISASNRRVTVGDMVSVLVDIDNKGRTPTTNARGDLPIGDAHERFTIPMLAPGQAKQTDVEFRTVSRAILPIGPLRIRKGDPFGLIRHEKELAERLTVFIHPKTVRLNTLSSGVPRDLEGQPSGQIVDDDLDFYGLREYEPGDDVRNVHWLSSAKTGTLMIRQYEATRRTDTSVTMSVNPDDYATSQEFEMAVSIHASIGVQCLLQDRPLFCHAGELHAQPRNAMEFLDASSAIEPDREDNPNLTEGTLRHSPDASFYFFTVGSLKSVDQIKRMTMALPRSASCVVLQADSGANRGIRRFANFTLATVGELDDLPLIMGVLA
ncbi:DUF58 domain-containing protein [Bifidobacterium callitrichidarum]|uniref:DUF58 domain-containing protein n=1 Tax=Bifidobacterium callitrichidarum TaxID=2052941 RepID=A0A2U2N5C7_9BIFI|nr:DUF58 domain-containing protein [Bifidobacterium callitrichidarum]PWG64431.1 DUF58 domain-containing protein [Bifidobacterium callitrichidarum]